MGSDGRSGTIWQRPRAPVGCNQWYGLFHFESTPQIWHRPFTKRLGPTSDSDVSASSGTDSVVLHLVVTTLMFTEQTLANPLPKPGHCARYSGENKPVQVCRRSNSTVAEGEILARGVLRDCALPLRRCVTAEVSESWTDPLPPGGSSGGDQRRPLCRGHKHTPGTQQAGPPHTTPVIIPHNTQAFTLIYALRLW